MSEQERSGPTPAQIVSNTFEWGPATGEAAIDALWEEGYEVRPRAERQEQTAIVETVLDGLRNVDHAVLDERYDLDSMYRDLMVAVLPLGRLHAFARMYESSEWGNVWDEVRQEVLEPSEAIVNHWTTGAPDYGAKDGDP